MAWTARQIAEITGGRLTGNGEARVESMQTVELAGPDQLTFIGDERYARRWGASRAAAALVAEGLELEAGEGRALIFVDDADLATATLLDLMAPPPPRVEPGVHASACVDPSASIGEGVGIGPNCNIGPGASIGAGTVVHAGVTVMEGSGVGAGCVLWPGVVIRERCTVGDGCILHPNVSIGADGFGYRPSPDGRGLVKIPQIGTVRVGDRVEIGAGSCIDRAKFGETTVGDGTKIDNLVQIGHNSRIGRDVIIVGCTAIAGSVTVGDGAIISGGAVVSDHVDIGPGARVAGASVLVRDVPAGETWAGYIAKPAKIFMREVAALGRLPEALRHMKGRA